MNRLSQTAIALAFSGLASLACAQQATGSSDEAITANVKSTFAQHPEIKADQITVTTKDGTVYLSGAVDTTTERKNIETIALQTAGVRKVVNQTNVTRGIN